MSKFVNKLKDILLGVDIEEDDDDMEDDMELDRRDRERAREKERAEISSFQSAASRNTIRSSPTVIKQYPNNASTNNVVDLHKKTQVNVCSPKNIEESRKVIDNTKSQIISIVNLEGVDGPTSQRIADFLSGSVDALDGTIRRLSDEMFIIAPYGVSVLGNLDEQINEELKSSGVGLPWPSSVFK